MFFSEVRTKKSRFLVLPVSQGFGDTCVWGCGGQLLQRLDPRLQLLGTSCSSQLWGPDSGPCWLLGVGGSCNNQSQVSLPILLLQRRSLIQHPCLSRAPGTSASHPWGVGFSSLPANRIFPQANPILLQEPVGPTPSGEYKACLPHFLVVHSVPTCNPYVALPGTGSSSSGLYL